MRPLLTFCVFCIIALNSLGQKSVSLQDFVSQVEHHSKSASRNVEIKQESFTKTFNNLRAYPSSSGAISIVDESTNQDPNLIFHLVKRNGKYKGVALDVNNEKGYEINSSPKGILQFIEKPKSELLFVCGEKTNQKNQKKISGVSDYIGNGKTETSVLKLESKPGATKVIYLDFDSEPSLFGWSESYTPSNYSEEAIKKNWENVSEDFIAFDVNVTTNRTLFDATPTVEKGWVVFADFHGNSWGGLAYLHSFGTGKPVLVDGDANGSTSNFLLMAASHELGHSLGLSHDGKQGGGSAYYAGHGEYSPIMGNGSRTVSHWSKGEYSEATNTEDDMTIIGNWLGLRADDYPTYHNLFVLVNDTVTTRDNFGMIESRSDIDTFKFELASNGLVELEINSSIKYTNLDLLVTVYDENLNQIASYNPIGQRHVTVSENLSTGIYFMTIEGDGELTVNDGFSDYSSFGYYQISGVIENHKIEGEDLIAVRIEGENNLCDKVYTPQIDVMNNGLNTINSFDVDVFIDGVLDHSETVNTTILSGITTTVTLNDISNFGEHSINFALSMSSGTETALYNNELTGLYTLKDGNTIQFSTDFDLFNGTSPLTWKILDVGSNEVVNSSEVATSSNSGSVTQDYCIANGCYDFVASGDFNLCVGIATYNNSSTYVLGNQVSYQGTIYEAKWWTQGTPPPAQQWKVVGTCNVGPYLYTLTDTYHGTELLNGGSNSYASGQLESFCINVITSDNLILDEKSIEIYPNPNNGSFTIISPMEQGNIEIVNSLGQSIENTSFNQSNIQINKDLSPGVYFLKINGENKSYTSKVIRR